MSCIDIQKTVSKCAAAGVLLHQYYYTRTLQYICSRSITTLGPCNIYVASGVLLHEDPAYRWCWIATCTEVFPVSAGHRRALSTRALSVHRYLQLARETHPWYGGWVGMIGAEGVCVAWCGCGCKRLLMRRQYNLKTSRHAVLMGVRVRRSKNALLSGLGGCVCGCGCGVVCVAWCWGGVVWVAWCVYHGVGRDGMVWCGVGRYSVRCSV
jgi:hypothetical protein